VEPLSAAVEAILAPPLCRWFDWRISGLEHVPQRGGVVLAANHISFLDPPALASVARRRGRRVRFLAMAELFASPFRGALLRNLGHIPVARRTDDAKSSLTAALAALDGGQCVGIFPEGGISRDLEPRPGQTGVARLARWSGVPVLPVGLWGTQRVAFPGHKIRLRRGIPIAVSVGAPLTVGADDDVGHATDRIMAAIAAEVARARAAYPGAPPGDDDWWVRSPDTAPLRCCRGEPEASAAGPAEADTRPSVATAGPGGADEPSVVAPAEVSPGGSVVLEQQLRSIAFFRNLPGPALEAVAGRLQPEHHAQGDVVFREGDPGDAMYLVASGQVEVLAGADQAPLAVLGPGSFVGELAVLLAEPRSASLRVGADTWLWALRRSDLDTLLADHPVIGVELSRELGRRLVATNRRVVIPPTTRFTAVFGRGARPLAAAVLARAGTGRVGVLDLTGDGVGEPLPEGVIGLAPERLDAEALAAMGGGAVEGLSHLLMIVPASETARGRAAVAVAEYIVAFAALPEWATGTGSAHAVLRCDGGEATLARTARWLTGQAVGLALSSGGSKTLAHLGVLRVLRRAGIEIDAVAGTSGGALVAAGVAFGMSEDDMLGHVEELAAGLRLRRLDLNLLPRAALFKGVRLRQQLDTWFGGAHFADAGVPWWVVATDVAAGEEVVIDRGPVADGIRASMSIPGAMNPWPVDGRLCMDGAVVNPMPASVLRDAGLRLVIGSNVAGQELAADGWATSPHLLQMMSRMVNSMEREMIKAQVPLVDVLIRPRVGPAPSFDFSRVATFIAEGERAAAERLPQLEAALAAAAAT
jgi:1-acyl-sn-glycerol-3-phosphate acyltransferase